MNSTEKKTRVQYVDNKAFAQAIVAYRKAVEKAKRDGTEPPRIPDYIGECITKIAYKLATMPRFINYSFRDEMVHDGIENCFLYFHDYDPEYESKISDKGPNPFAYFTQVVFFAFIRRINKEEKIRYTVHRSFYFNVVHGNVGSSEYESSTMFDDGEKNLMPSIIYDNIAASMARFEKKESDKKTKRETTKKQGLQRFFDED